jgi:hypothetical protein
VAGCRAWLSLSRCSGAAVVVLVGVAALAEPTHLERFVVVVVVGVHVGIAAALARLAGQLAVADRVVDDMASAVLVLLLGPVTHELAVGEVFGVLSQAFVSGGS